MRPVRQITTVVACVALLCLLHMPLALGQDKSGVTPTTISLPTGPGSIEGLGNSFQPMLNTGTAKYSIKIKLPQGTAGHSPDLSLQYESGAGDGALGIGWTFGPKSIRRQTAKGIPHYVDGPNSVDDDHDGQVDEPDEVDRFIGIEGEELIQLTNGYYRSRIEKRFIRYSRVGGHWVAELPNGTKLEFGISQDGKVTDATGTKIFKWLLEKSTDPNGNVIQYFYTSLSQSDNQKYLKEIRYGPGAPPWGAFYFAYFTYEDRPDWRKDYRSGFLIKTSRRLHQIDVGIQGILPAQCAQGDWNNDGTQDALIRRYALAYENILSFASHLIQVTQFGSDGVNYLPPITFTYSGFIPDETISAHGAVIGSQNAPYPVMDSELVDLVDLNRDGLPDILKTDAGGGGHVCYYNLGVSSEGGTRQVHWDEGHVVDSPDGLAAILALADDSVYLADMDGNGISDLIQTPVSQEVYYFLNQGNGSWGERKRMSIQGTSPPPPFVNDDVTTLDLSFDKRMDVVQSTDNGYRVWLNLAEGSYAQETYTPGATYNGQVIRFSSSGVRFADMNGDRIVDVVKITPTRVIYCASMGYGLFDTAVEIQIPGAVLSDGASGQVARARLKDINGDGLADLVVERAVPNELWYWLNLGTDAFSSRHIITNMPTQFGSNATVRWADINGNGTTDLIYADSASDDRIIAIDLGELVGGSAHPNLLIGIDNGLGVHTEITYRPSTMFYLKAIEDGDPWSVTLPFPVSVVSQVRVSTGLDLDETPGNDEYIKQYSYRDGFYEDREKAFRGFGEVKVTELGDATSPTRVTTHGFFTGGPDGQDNDGDGEVDEVSQQYYREEDALKGKLKGITVSGEDGTLFSESINTWLVRNLAISVDGIEHRFAYMEEAQKLFYEGTTSPQTTRTTYLYDDYGNITEKRDYGAISLTGDEAFTFKEFINDTTLWLLGLCSRTYVTDQNLTKFSEAINYYDGQDYIGLGLGLATRGNLTMQEGWVEGTTYVNLVRNAYSSYGNIIGLQDPNGNLRTVTYDATMHAFPVEETIEVGNGNPDLVFSATYNLGLGVLTAGTDFNNNQTTYRYDCFGRITSIVRPGDSTSLPTKAFSYVMTDPQSGLIYSYDPAGVLTLTTGAPPAPSSITTQARESSGEPGTFDTIKYVDGMGRKLALVKEAESGFVVSDAVLIDKMGRPYRKFLPYFASSSSYSAPPLSNPSLEFRYDVPGREILRINPPDAANVVTNVTTSYQPLQKSATDENGKTKTFAFDGHDKVIEIHEELNGEDCITTISRDPLANVTKVTDSQGNVRTFEYDGLSRTTALKDPDRGTKEYTYDAAGNIIQSVDNKAQVITYTYDGANRRLTEDYQDSALINPDIAYHYDIPSSDYPQAANTAGRLSWVEDLSGASFFSYDANGHVAWLVKRIKDGRQEQDFVTMFNYDAMDRLVSTIFPDGDAISNQYNNGSHLEAIADIIANLDYLASGKRASVTYANGLKTDYSYDPRNRLISLVTDKITPTGDPIQDISYTLDGASNVTQITDNRSAFQGTAQNASQSLEYDDLYRLTRAQGPGYGTINFNYDKIGNMTFKASPDAPDPQHIDNALINLGAMTIGGAAGTSNRTVRNPGDDPGPHAITATASGLSFAYDDNGNMVDSNGDIYEWDFKDRLSRTTASGILTDYVYDYAGRRVIKRCLAGSTQSVTYYINKGFEIRQDRPIKYVFDGKRRVARIQGRLTEPGSQSLQVLNLREGWNFISLQVEPQDPAIGAVLAPISGKYSGIWKYDPATSQYVGYVPSQGITDLTELHGQEGYLIHVTSGCMLTINGTQMSNDISLVQGWNLVPCPSDHPVKVEDALQSIAGKYEALWAYDPIAKEWKTHVPSQGSVLNTLDMMQPGTAYWLEVSEPSQLVFLHQPAKILFYHTDHVGSSNVITDSNATVVERTEYYPFGLIRYHLAAPFDSSYKFVGKERDKETGLDYFAARYYSPVTCRFISVDPLVETGRSFKNLHAYSYGNNNPLSFVDITGLSSQSAQDLSGSDEEAGGKDKEPGSSWDQLEKDLRKTLLAIGLNFLQTALREAGVSDVAQYITGGLGLAIMGYEAWESGDWEKGLVTSLGAVETGIAVFGGKKLALVEMYQYGKGMYEMGKGAYEAVTTNAVGAAKYGAIKAGMEVYQKGPEGAWNSLIQRVKPPQIWGEATGATPMWGQAKGRARELMNPYIEEGVGYLPFLTDEEKSMVKSGTEGIIY